MLVWLKLENGLFRTEDGDYSIVRLSRTDWLLRYQERDVDHFLELRAARRAAVELSKVLAAETYVLIDHTNRLVWSVLRASDPMTAAVRDQYDIDMRDLITGIYSPGPDTTEYTLGYSVHLVNADAVDTADLWLSDDYDEAVGLSGPSLVTVELKVTRAPSTGEGA